MASNGSSTIIDVTENEDLIQITPQTKVSTWKWWHIILLGQLIAILNAGTAVFSKYLTRHEVSIPAFQNLPTYIILILYIIPMLYKRYKRRYTRNIVSDSSTTLHQKSAYGSFDDTTSSSIQYIQPVKHNSIMSCLKPVFSSWYFYALIALLDVEGNFFIVRAYRYTSLFAVQLLDSANLPFVMVLSCIFLGSKFSNRRLFACSLCLIGLLLCIFSDIYLNNHDNHDNTLYHHQNHFSLSSTPSYFLPSSSSTSHTTTDYFTDKIAPAVLGDIFVICACLCYASCNIAQEATLRSPDQATTDTQINQDHQTNRPPEHHDSNNNNNNNNNTSLYDRSTLDHLSYPSSSPSNTRNNSITNNNSNISSSSTLISSSSPSIDNNSSLSFTNQGTITAIVSHNSPQLLISTEQMHIVPLNTAIHQSNKSKESTREINQQYKNNNNDIVSSSSSYSSLLQPLRHNTRQNIHVSPLPSEPNHHDSPQYHYSTQSYQIDTSFEQRCEYLTYIGLFGTIICFIQAMIIEYTSLKTLSFSWYVIVYWSGFTICLVSMYSLIPILLIHSGSVVLNLSLLTTDGYSISLSLLLFKDYITLWYYVAVCIIVCGIILYNTDKDPDADNNDNDNHDINVHINDNDHNDNNNNNEMTSDQDQELQSSNQGVTSNNQDIDHNSIVNINNIQDNNTINDMALSLS